MKTKNLSGLRLRWGQTKHAYGRNNCTLNRLLLLIGLRPYLFDSYPHFVESIKARWHKIKYKPIYYSWWSRDCDMCESAGVSVYYAGEKAFERMWDKEAEWADGPGGYEIITKEMYLEMKDAPTYHRDRIMEAYENGNGRSIYV